MDTEVLEPAIEQELKEKQGGEKLVSSVPSRAPAIRHTKKPVSEAENLSLLLLANDLIRQGLRQKAIDALDKALDSVRTYWDGAAKCHVQEPDTTNRVKAAFGVLAYTDGKVPDRQEIVSVLATINTKGQDGSDLPPSAAVIVNALADRLAMTMQRGRVGIQAQKYDEVEPSKPPATS